MVDMSHKLVNYILAENKKSKKEGKKDKKKKDKKSKDDSDDDKKKAKKEKKAEKKAKKEAKKAKKAASAGCMCCLCFVLSDFRLVLPYNSDSHWYAYPISQPMVTTITSRMPSKEKRTTKMTLEALVRRVKSTKSESTMKVL